MQDKANDWKEIGRIPLDDVLAVITHAHGLTYTNNLLVELATRGIPFVLTSDFHEAVGMLWPVQGHHQQAKRFDAQLAMTLPQKKSLWASVVKAKLKMQLWALSEFGIESKYIERLVAGVKSGDPDNREGQAARVYWKILFGEVFIRDRESHGINTLLNYGYMVFRSAMARAVISAGLHPTVGLHHANDFNAMRLVDDLMEPYRPIVDVIVKKIELEAIKEGKEIDLTDENKRRLVQGLFINTQQLFEKTPVMVSMQKLALSLALVALKEQEKLNLPLKYDFDVDSFEI